MYTVLQVVEVHGGAGTIALFNGTQISKSNESVTYKTYIEGGTLQLVGSSYGTGYSATGCVEITDSSGVPYLLIY